MDKIVTLSLFFHLQGRGPCPFIDLILIQIFYRFGNEEKSAFVVLINFDKNTNPKYLSPICYIKNDNGKLFKKQAEIDPIHDLATSECRLLSYRLTCHSLETSTDMMEPEFSLKIKTFSKIKVKLFTFKKIF